MHRSHRLAMAQVLLAKATATPYEPEQETFASGAFEQLSVFLGGPASPRLPLHRPAGADSRVRAWRCFAGGPAKEACRVGGTVDVLL